MNVFEGPRKWAGVTAAPRRKHYCASASRWFAPVPSRPCPSSQLRWMEAGVQPETTGSRQPGTSTHTAADRQRGGAVGGTSCSSTSGGSDGSGGSASASASSGGAGLCGGPRSWARRAAASSPPEPSAQLQGALVGRAVGCRLCCATAPLSAPNECLLATYGGRGGQPATSLSVWTPGSTGGRLCQSECRCDHLMMREWLPPGSSIAMEIATSTAVDADVRVGSAEHAAVAGAGRW